MLLLYVSILTAWATGSAPGITQTQQPAAQEQWINPGVSVPPTTNLSQFVEKMDGAIVGTLERVSMVFLDESEPSTLHTVLTFRVNERLFGPTPEQSENQIDVLMHGGTFVEQNGRRVPKRPTEFAGRLAIGAEYFVPIQKGDKFGKAGRLMVGSALAMSRLDGGTVTPVVRNVTWSNQVIAQAKRSSAVPGPAPSPRDVLLTAIREAGRGK